jgi:dTDP-4-amino-4,6-dideoxygalactose transaminase
MSTDAERGPGAEFLPVPLLDVQGGNEPLLGEILTQIEKVCRSGWFCLGPEVQRLEQAMAELCGTRFGIACASGSDALLLSLMAIDIRPGDEVIVPSFTFFATASAVTRLGGKPVWVDIDPITFNIDPALVEAAVTPATRAIIPVHLFGQCAEMDPINQIANRHGLTVVEDAAQSHGAQYNGRTCGSLGDVGCFSFYPTKNLGGFGDAGMLVTSDETLAERFRLLRGHGMHPRYYHKFVGVNSRMDAIQAAALNVKIRHLGSWSARRKANAERYHQLFTQAGLTDTLGLPATLPGRGHVWNQYTIRVPDGRRDQLRQFLTERKIGTEIYYPVALHQQDCFRELGFGEADLPETERATREVLHLPIFPELTAEQQQSVVGRIAEHFAEETRTRTHVVKAPSFSQDTPQRRSA